MDRTQAWLTVFGSRSPEAVVYEFDLAPFSPAMVDEFVGECVAAAVRVAAADEREALRRALAPHATWLRDTLAEGLGGES